MGWASPASCIARSQHRFRRIENPSTRVRREQVPEPRHTENLYVDLPPRQEALERSTIPECKSIAIPRQYGAHALQRYFARKAPPFLYRITEGLCARSSLGNPGKSSGIFPIPLSSVVQHAPRHSSAPHYPPEASQKETSRPYHCTAYLPDGTASRITGRSVTHNRRTCNELGELFRAE